ncbi:MAG: phospho-sugar mutase [Planctomycetaceae bacterium]|nr:phospho-sugar mutase [Planctomycetaceae bacterium]
MTDALEPRRSAARTWLESDAARRALTPATIANVRHWLERPAYRDAWPALLALVEAKNTGELTRLFWEQIPFGTGGRRGPMAEIGSATINRRTIAESARGLADYVRQATGIARPRAVIAFDSRLRSVEFAQLTAAVLAAADFDVFLYPSARATPQLSFSVRHLECHCGVMISASHNPPADNGFKAYWSHGGQVLPPHDKGIIDGVNACDEIPLGDYKGAVASGAVKLLDDSIDHEYVNAVAALSLSSARDVKLLYTPLHGVGETSIVPVLRQAGFTGLEIFEPQRAQNGHFPNVPDHLPNPERTAVFGPAMDYAEVNGHDVIMASDPDADRLAVALRMPDGRYDCLNGNQLGALLTDYALKQRAARGELTREHYVLETLVTTPLIAAIAKSYGVQAIRDLPVGFKHVAAAMDRLGPDKLVIACEESVGYLAGQYCRDKDAAVAALWTAELTAELKAQGRTLNDQLDELHRRHGYHRESQIAKTFPGPTGAAQIAGLIKRFREHPITELGTATLERVRDYGRREIRRLRDNRVVGTLDVDAGDLLMVDARDDGVTIELGMRPSGTEPKIKFYLFASTSPTMPFPEAQSRTLRVMKNLQQALEAWIAGGVASSAP